MNTTTSPHTEIGEPSIAKIAALIGDHARATALTAMLANHALTATELANLANVSKQTMSAHLTKLLAAQLIAVEQQGRHRYFRLANAEVAQLIESLMGVAQRAGAHTLRPGPRAPAMRYARVCYDHLAGELGVLAYDSLQEQGFLCGEGDQLRLTEAGLAWCASLGLDNTALAKQKRALCLPCLDWSERRHHLGGALGAALLQHYFAQGWAKRVPDSRVVEFSAHGEEHFRQSMKVLGK